MKKFPGFPPEGQYWQFPTIINGFVHQLTGAEFKVLWYILRHTYGFQKDKDAISLTQFEKGIKGWDKGTGLSREQIIQAIKGLEKWGFVKVERRKKGRINKYKPVVKKFDYYSQKSRPVGSQKSRHTIDNITINNKQYSSSKKKKKKKPYFRGDIMRYSQGKWWVVKDNGEWLEFAGSEKDITWK